MSQSTNTVPADSVLIPATDPVASQGVFFTVAELREAMSPVGYMTAADQINAAAAAAAQATANAAIPASSLGQPLGPVQADATNKVPLANLPSSVLGSSHYLGTWNASTNTPLIQSGTAPAVASPVGGYYIVSVSGTPTIDGVSKWQAGDWIIWNGTIWSNISGQVNPVSSVAGLQGAVSTSQLANALAGSVGLSSTGGQLNVVLGTSANTAAAGNDGRIVGAAQTSGVYSYLTNVAAIGSYTGNSPSLRTAGYYTAGDGGGAFYSQTNTGAPAIVDGSGRSWYLQDVNTNHVNILQFGAKADGVSDMQPAWAAADAYAVANGKAVFIPSSGSGSWVLRTPMVSAASRTCGEAATGLSKGTIISWRPTSVTELATALTNTPTSQSFLVSDLTIYGTDQIPTSANIVSSGWLPALATANCTFSGSVMTASGTTGTWAVGQTVSGPGMSNFCTISSFGTGTGGDGTYNLSAAQTVSGSISATATGYPNLSAFKAGTAGFTATYPGIYRNCYTQSVKYGLVLESPFGHVYSYNCGWKGLFGVYCRRNTQDYYFEGCDLTGSIWSGILSGSGVYGGSAQGGINFRAVRCHFGYSPLGMDMLNDGGTNLSAGTYEFYGCSFENIGEAMIRTISGSAALSIYFDMFPNGNFDSAMGFPTSIIGTPAQYYFYLPGQLNLLKSLSSNVTNVNRYPALPSFPAGSRACAYIGKINTNISGDMDLDIFAGSVVFGQYLYEGIDVRNPDIGRDYLKRRDQAIRSGLLEKGNLLKNPEVASNWTVVNSGSTVSVVPLSSLASGALSGVAIPPQVYRESDNPNVVVITNPQGIPYLDLGASTSSWNKSRSLCLHGWIFSSGSGTASNVITRLSTNNNAEYFEPQAWSRGEAAFTELILQGMYLSDLGVTSVTGCQVVGNSSGQTIYIIGLMLSEDRISAPNQLPGPYAPSGIYIGNEAAGLTAQQAFNVIPFAGTPTGSAPNGSLGININATGTGSLYQYLSNAWVQIH